MRRWHTKLIKNSRISATSAENRDKQRSRRQPGGYDGTIVTGSPLSNSASFSVFVFNGEF